MGEVCTLHNRTKHGMRSFPQLWRADRKIMERLCPHGIGHPDPDEYKIIVGIDDGVHGCDGCCMEPGEQDPMEIVESMAKKAEE